MRTAMSYENDDKVLVDCELVAWTNLAILVDNAVTQDWLPLSQIEVHDIIPMEFEKGKAITIGVPYWLAMDKGMI